MTTPTVCDRCAAPIEHGPYLLCTHGSRPLHPQCLAAELDEAVFAGRSHEYRRCNCAELQQDAALGCAIQAMCSLGGDQDAGW